MDVGCEAPRRTGVVREPARRTQAAHAWQTPSRQMATGEGRAPRPPRGDPNVKMMRLSLTPEEWRRLRLWAAEEDASTEHVVGEIVRRELAKRPRTTF
jgi:hypothetical protein